MNAFLKFLQAARNLQKNQGLSKADILKFAQNEFGDITGLMRAQIDNIFKPRKPIPKKDPVFDRTVEKMQFDDKGKPFNPKDPLKNLSKKDKESIEKIKERKFEEALKAEKDKMAADEDYIPDIIDPDDFATGGRAGLMAGGIMRANYARGTDLEAGAQPITIEGDIRPDNMKMASESPEEEEKMLRDIELLQEMEEFEEFRKNNPGGTYDDFKSSKLARKEISDLDLILKIMETEGDDFGSATKKMEMYRRMEENKKNKPKDPATAVRKIKLAQGGLSSLLGE